jgi:hypothetical protein
MDEHESPMLATPKRAPWNKGKLSTDRRSAGSGFQNTSPDAHHRGYRDSLPSRPI